MLYVKIMSAEDLPDTDPYKNYSIIPVENNEAIRFVNNQFYEEPKTSDCPRRHRYEMHIEKANGSWETHIMFGNAYVMNERGQTIASHSA